MIDALEHSVRRQGRPFFGICVGMQLMAERGREYRVTPGLGWIAGEVDRGRDQADAGDRPDVERPLGQPVEGGEQQGREGVTGERDEDDGASVLAGAGRQGEAHEGERRPDRQEEDARGRHHRPPALLRRDVVRDVEPAQAPGERPRDGGPPQGHRYHGDTIALVPAERQGASAG